jgi:DNA-binding CsgD family transcriptional regulator
LLDVAVKAGVLRSEPEVSFTHALVRDAVYEELAPSQRMALHHRAALALEQSDTCAAGRIANHWRQSGSPDWTVHCIRWARAAAASAVASLAYDEAVKFVALAWQAAGSDGDAELALELARAEFLAGQIGDSLAHCETAARLADGQPDLLARAALVITGMGDTRTLATVDRLCANALRHVPEEAAATRARLLAQRAIAVADTCTAADYARALSAEALELAESSGDPDALLDGIHARHITLCAPQYRDERVQLARRACALAETAKQPLAALWGHVWLVDAAFQIGDLAAVDYELNQIEQFATARQHALAWWHLMRLRATRAALIGELEQAAAFNEEAGAFADRLGAEGTRGLYYAFLNQLALLRGTMDRATGEATLALLRTVREVTLARVFIPITHALLGDMAAARATFEEFRHMPRTVQPGLRWAPLVYHIGVVAIMLDDVETADLVHGCLSKLEPDCMNDGSGALFCAGASTRMLGDLSLTCGRVPEAIGHYRHAIDLNARIGARPFLALSRLGLAKALVAQGGPLTEARELATAAAAEFRRLDLPRPLATADSLLATISTAARDANPLSRREAEVAALIGEALSNRQIASRLVLSERTVESHVRSILGKLGFSSRTEIAAWRLREP